MSETCSGSCETCGQDCAQRTAESLLAPANAGSNVKKVIAVMSGKGGVGKSTVTSLLAVAVSRLGFRVGVLDADITGPSIPKAFGLDGEILSDGEGLFPAETAGGIKVMSVNLLLPDKESPVVWRGPIIGGTVKQFWTDVHWGDVDYLFVDMPPGTGDVPLTVFQSLPVDGAVVVTSPQDLVTLIVKKAVNMAGMMKIPVLGAVENYSFFRCPDCGKEHPVFGESRIDRVASELGIPVLAKLPIDPALAALCDQGQMEKADVSCVASAAEKLTR